MPGELLGFVRCRDRWQRWRQESCSDQQLPSPAGWWRQLDDGILLDECCIFLGDDSDYPGVGKCPVLGSLNFTKTNICWRGKRRIKVGWCEKWGYLYTHIYQHLLPCHVDSTGTPRCWRSSWHLPQALKPWRSSTRWPALITAVCPTCTIAGTWRRRRRLSMQLLHFLSAQLGDSCWGTLIKKNGI